MGDTVQQTTTQTTNNAFDVLAAWVFTPTGATLTLMLLVIGGGSLVMKLMGRGSRLLSIAGTVTAFLFFTWIVSGILEAFGIPVREWIRSIAMQLPDIGPLFKALIERLLYTAG